MSQQAFSGTGVAMITPFLSNGDIDFSSLKKLLEHLIKGKVEYLVVMGTTGESATISRDEKQAIFSFIAEQNAGRLPLMAGIGGNDTREVTSAMKSFNLEGYSAILSVSPYYNKPNQQGLYLHHKALHEESPLPVLMYNVPGRTGMNVTAETTLRIAEDCKRIFGTKEASGNLDQVHQIIKYAPKDFMIISGDDGIALPIIAAGGHGVISVVANAYPADFSEMIRYCLKGDFAAARPLHYKYTDIIQSLFAEGNPSGVKAYLSEMGICENQFRLPVAPVSEGLMQKIRGMMG